MKIPLVDVCAQNSALSNEIETAIGAVINSSSFIGGDEVESFEKSFAQRHGGGYVIGVGSGSDALNLALQSLDLKPGDEVITVPNTWISTVFAISHAGATPVFADINPETYQIDIAQLEKRIPTVRKLCIYWRHLVITLASFSDISGYFEASTPIFRWFGPRKLVHI